MWNGVYCVASEYMFLYFMLRMVKQTLIIIKWKTKLTDCQNSKPYQIISPTWYISLHIQYLATRMIRLALIVEHPGKTNHWASAGTHIYEKCKMNRHLHKLEIYPSPSTLKKMKCGVLVYPLMINWEDLKLLFPCIKLTTYHKHQTVRTVAKSNR